MEAISRSHSTVPAALTNFVGRDQLVADALELLRSARLVTMTGPGGVGKTRLAFELVRRVESDYDELAIVRMAEVGSPNGIERSLIGSLGIIDQSSQPPIDVLIEYLHARQVLLVLDNCEHLWEAIGDVVTVLLEEAPRLTVVATSRRYLEVAGEHVLHVPPLTVPDAGADHEQAVHADAVVLLLDRIRAVGRSVPSGDEWDAVVELVRWSGGLPLVLELIAVRMGGGMSPAVILQRLDGGRLLTRGQRVQTHHKALRQVLNWSFDLCNAGEQRLWARLSVFTGGFDLAMAEEVCGDPDGVVATGDVMDLLAGLVRQSIVIAGPDGRFQQLQPLREYGLQQLQAIGELGLLRARHCAFVRRLAAAAADQWYGPGQMDWLDRIGLELANIRAALNYCHTPDRAETGLGIVTDITRMNLPFFAALIGEFCAWFETLLAAAPDKPTEARVVAVALLGWMRICQGDRVRARARYEECNALADQLDVSETPPVMFLRGTYLLLSQGDPRSGELLRKARDAFRAGGAYGDAHMAWLLLTFAASFLGTEEEAEQVVTECLADAEAHQAPWATNWARWSKGLAARGSPEVALALMQQCLVAQIELGDRWGNIWCVEVIAWLRAAQRQGELAAELLGGAMSLQQQTGVQVAGLVPFGRERERAVARARAAIGDDAFNAAYQAGTALSREQVHALALADSGPARQPVPRAHEFDLLTDRQREVAVLVAKGLSNKAIADTLAISQRTVENHLGQIFTRLGVHNRAQVAAWIAKYRTHEPER